MKKIFLILFVITLTLSSFVMSIELLPSFAVVEQHSGVNVFILSKPQSNYEYMGKVSPGLVMTGSNSDLLQGMIDKAIKKYPGCDGILISDLSFENAEVIKFKK